MGRQYYVIFSHDQEQELFHYVRNMCGFEVVPIIHHGDSFRDSGNQRYGFKFIPPHFKKYCRYVVYDGERGLSLSYFDILSLRRRDLPHIEYWAEVVPEDAGIVSARIYYDASHTRNKAEKTLFDDCYDMIKKWVRKNAAESVKEGPVLFCFYKGCEKMKDKIIG